MRPRRFSGFTLVELMTVVVVIAILVAVAFPSYQDHVRKAKRAEGKTALLKAAQVLERNYSDNNVYVVDIAPLFALGAGATVYSGDNPADTTSAYTIAVAPATVPCALVNCFLLTATPNAPFTDPDCGNLTLTSTGVRCWSTSGAPATSCTPTTAAAGIVAKCKW